MICYRLDVQRIEGRGYDFVELEGLGLRFIRVFFIGARVEVFSAG